MANGKPSSFLRVIRSDLEFGDEISPYDPKIYERAKENLQKFLSEGALVREDQASLYIYRLHWKGHRQTGLVATSAIDDYFNDVIKKHEFTRPEKEKDRTTHIDVLGANTGPVFLLYRSADQAEIAKLMDGHADANAPLYDESFDDGVRHQIYPVPPGDLQSKLLELFGKLSATYIADGHHRAASANSVGRLRRERAGNVSGSELFNHFLTVIFPDDQMKILPYNRAVKDLGGMNTGDFIESLRANGFRVSESKHADPGPYEMNLYVEGRWIGLTASEALYKDADEIGRLAPSILQNHVLAPMLGIDDPRTSDRVSFVGGIRGDQELQRLVDSGKFACAFAMPPVTTAQLLAVADAGKVMPPKSTWFEPKLRSGFLVHLLDD